MWVAALAIVVGGLVTAEVGRRGAAGQLARNTVAGIRTPTTMASDEAWRAAHVAAGPAMVTTGLVAAVVGIGAGAAGALAGEVAATAGVTGAGVLLLGGVLLAARRGVLAARATAR